MTKSWPLSRELLLEILSDRTSDTFVCKLIWERLDYKLVVGESTIFLAGLNTPEYWSERFPEAPQVIAKRSASIHLTRSIPKKYKQALKTCLNFEGYKINELFPRRTRRATAVNWLLAWTLSRGEVLPSKGPLPTLCNAPEDPVLGHPGDPCVE